MPIQARTETFSETVNTNNVCRDKPLLHIPKIFWKTRVPKSSEIVSLIFLANVRGIKKISGKSGMGGGQHKFLLAPVLKNLKIIRRKN